MQYTQKLQAMRRGWKAWLGGALLPVLVGGGCQNMSNTDAGILGGAGVGAVLGTIIGGATRHPGAGAAIGAVTGAVAGGGAGALADRAEARAEARNQAAIAAANQRPPLSLEEIQQMSARGISDDVIIGQIRTSGSVYNLTADQVTWLHDYGVHDGVIREMQATAWRTPRRIYTAAPVVQPVYVVEPMPPPPPVGIGIGFGYTRVR
jgi:hypothetical protein